MKTKSCIQGNLFIPTGHLKEFVVIDKISAGHTYHNIYNGKESNYLELCLVSKYRTVNYKDQATMENDFEELKTVLADGRQNVA